MATPTPPTEPLTPDQRLALQQKQRYDNLTRNVAIGCVIVCPAIILMPPRKLDWYTFGLSIGTYLAADHLVTIRTGRSIYENLPISSSFSSANANKPGMLSALPTERAVEMRDAIRAKESLREGNRELGAAGTQGSQGSNADKGVVQRLWMGDEKEGWKERRLQEEKEALDRGESYGSIIMQQIWDVWNWDKKGEDGKVREEGEEPKK